MNEKASKLDSVRTCPSCGGELEKGYLFVETSLVWDKVKPKWTGYSRDSILLTPYPHIRVVSIRALRCKDCQIISFEYENSGSAHL